jgi:hypothetical protein
MIDAPDTTAPELSLTMPDTADTLPDTPDWAAAAVERASDRPRARSKALRIERQY